MPGGGQFLLHAPRFARAEIDLGSSGRTLRIEAPEAKPGERRFVESVIWAGRAHHPVWLSWEALQSGATLSFKLSPQPDPQGWGTRARDLPHAPAGLAH